MSRFFSLLLTLYLVQNVHAQVDGSVEVGDRVRVALQSRVMVEQRERVSTYQITGEVREVAADSLFIVPEGYREVHAVDLSSALSLEVGERRSRKRTALIGAGAGLLTSAVVAGALEISCAQTTDCWGGIASYVVGVYLLPPLVLGGATIGALLPGYRWRDVPLRGRLGIRHLDRRPGLSLTLQW